MIPIWAQVLMAMPFAALEIGVMLWLAKRYFGFELPKIITIGETDIERAKEVSYIQGYRDGSAQRILRIDTPLTEAEAQAAKQRFLAAQPGRCVNCAHAIGMHWDDNNRGRPGCHTGGCLCPMTPSEIRGSR